MIKNLQDTLTLNNGVKMPGFGFGVFQIPDDQTAAAVSNAIQQGYRLIDTAQIYGNEAGTGAGIQAGLAKTGLQRSDLFVTSKVWNDHLSYEETIAAYNDSLAKLGLDYLDLYLIHWPGDDAYRESWRALEDLYLAGKIKAIGVSNFEQHHFDDLMTTARVKPVLNQVEIHPLLTQEPMRAYAADHDFLLQAWSPLAQGKLFGNPVMEQVAQKYGKSVAQLILKWDVQRDVLVITKSTNPDRIAANADVFDFTISDADMAAIDALNAGLRVGPNPDEFDF
ncbi:MAG TPA: aldo/keto reductase [Candidatus Levilactobacillus faecigallinarum]|uniref:Aldo/keto reductase n=1 Tax=Candidatus Levilactobacillus faecigallinarum TaxID=2838638 RepID=A0A9D1U5J7_9LACO|nr:aldo/keto reductase [Candidatus Levilactobacillus faecigallinarum]